MSRLATSAVAFALIVTGAVSRAQDAAALASDPALFLETAQRALHWTEPADPVHIVGPLYFVGTRGLGAFLITTSEGHILLNTGMPGSGPMIEESIRQLGFKPEDIKLLLAGHAHVDHVGGHAYIQKLSHAQVGMMAEEVGLLESGGTTDFHYGTYRQFHFDPVKVTRVLHDGEMFRVGDVTLVALLTPGHTRGSTTFLMRMTDGRNGYTVIFPGATTVNPGYRLSVHPSYPAIAADYRRTFQILETLRPDIWLGAHNDTFDFEAKRARAAHQGVVAWIDPQGYQKAIAADRARFEAAIQAELENSPTATSGR